MKIMRCNRTRR